ncbi:LOW QUALITY PROTEIN: hypothetical protein ACHAW5_001031 [Stephanodiscus triporus]|uniref:Uncharacterized protein n=1 Tax=Stephanodiscus triporus TaxID=2934178 RepID=A0ABD3PLA0_9STRA
MLSEQYTRISILILGFIRWPCTERRAPAAFNSGAAGYVLSRSTMEKLINEWDNPESKCSASSASEIYPRQSRHFDRAVLWAGSQHSWTHATTGIFLTSFMLIRLVRTVTGKVDDWYVKKHKIPR